MVMETVSSHLLVVYNEHLKYPNIWGRINVASRTCKEYCAVFCPFSPATERVAT
jgi:hypothetical protein